MVLPTIPNSSALNHPNSTAMNDFPKHMSDAREQYEHDVKIARMLGDDSVMGLPVDTPWEDVPDDVKAIYGTEQRLIAEHEEDLAHQGVLDA
jgi:hypothetical protein